VIQASHSSGVGRGLQKLIVVARVRCAPMTKKVDVALQLGKKLPSSGCLLHLRTVLRPLSVLLAIFYSTAYRLTHLSQTVSHLRAVSRPAVGAGIG
jgi:hypothetical protein